MNAFVAIFAREFRLRRMLVIGALAIGFIGPVFLGLTGQIAADSVPAVALLIGLLTCAIYALVLGSGALARDLVDGRLGFDFVRPISGFSIWAGRFGAAAALLVVSALLVVAPALLADLATNSAPVRGIDWFPTSLGTAGLIAVGLLACLVLLFITHGIVVLFASRSAILVLDFVGLVAVGLTVAAALNRLHRNWAQSALAVCEISFFAFLLVVLICASLAQLLVGRTDLARSHRALSIALWVPLLVGALALDAASRWVVSPKTSDLLRADAVFEAPAGSWFAVGGNLRNRGDLAGRFLIDAATGRVVRQGVSRDSWFFSTTFSRDGKIAAWISESPKGTEVLWADLSASEPKVKTAPISFGRIAEVPSLSPSGRWFAARSNGRLLVFELRTGRLVASVPVNSNLSMARTAWIGVDRLRFWSVVGNAPVPAPQQISIAEIQVPSEPGAVIPVGSIERSEAGFAWGVSHDGTTLVVRDNSTGHRQLFDGRTGATLGVIDEPRQSGGVLLPEGLVAIVVRRPEPRSLAIYDRTGALRRRFDLRGYPGLLLAGQPTPTTILGSVSVAGSPKSELRRLILFDLATGTIRKLGRGGVPPLDPAESRGKLVRIGPAAFARWDPTTEKLQPIIPR